MTCANNQVVERPASPVKRLLRLDAAIADYDRTRRLLDGRVKPAGIELSVIDLHVGDFCTLPVYEQYDVAEMSFSWFVMAKGRGEPVVALPIFPLRVAILAYALVRRDSPYHKPSDLIGKRVGTSAYRMTVNLWLRGIFSDHYGLTPDQVTWVTCEAEGAGFSIPAGIKNVLREDRTPEQLLERGEVDALFLPVLPRSFVEGQSNFRRLFDDAQAEMRSYVQQTKILPITHTIVMKQSLSEQEPWVSESLIQAFAEAQRQCDEFWRTDEKRLSLADGVFFLEQHRATYGANPYAQGLAQNRHVLETFLRYAHEQGYISRRLSVEELFPANTLSL
jgi:4,5-dihydroxyphthalate decarboxylase